MFSQGSHGLLALQNWECVTTTSRTQLVDNVTKGGSAASFKLELDEYF